MYTYKALNDIGMPQLADCFNLAFSDYEQSIRFTPESLQYYLTASSVNLSLSYGAFCDEQLIGFILNADGIYNEQRVVFDAGTGIIPEHRGKKVFSGLFEYTVGQLQNCGISKYCLEVLQSNHHAVSIYSKKGFTVQREYSVLVASGPKYDRTENVEVAPYQEFKAFPVACSVAPSFEHTLHTVNRNPQLYEVLYLENKAYCIYAKRNGELIQLHYNELDALKKVVAALTERHPKAMAKNIDCSCGDVIRMLEEIGFVEFLKQYEMAREIETA